MVGMGAKVQGSWAEGITSLRRSNTKLYEAVKRVLGLHKLVFRKELVQGDFLDSLVTVPPFLLSGQHPLRDIDYTCRKRAL